MNIGIKNYLGPKSNAKRLLMLSELNNNDENICTVGMKYIQKQRLLKAHH